MSTPAYLLLEDGRRFDGRALGALEASENGTEAVRIAPGEVIFNTCMTGYQEVLTDPSYTGQLVVMTYPLIGNYGVNGDDAESSRAAVAGLIVRESSRLASNWRSQRTLDSYLKDEGVAGLTDVDTRALTLHIRSRGAMRGAIASASVPEHEAMAHVLATPVMEGLDLACGVSTEEPYRMAPDAEASYRVVALDYGMKLNSARLLVERDCSVSVVPARSGVEEILEMEPDGVFCSNGPGDPAAVEGAGETIRALIEHGTPTLGICLGHQLICSAFGASTFKMPFGHHGGNHPVRNLERDHVEITSQNHGFAVAYEGESVPGAPELRVTHVNLYDRTLEGVAHRELPLISVQYHPEAAPGPRDSSYLFDDFVGLMAARTGPRRAGNDPSTALAHTPSSG